MNLDKWTHTISHREIGTTTVIGSPRGWVYRSVDSKIPENFRDKNTHPGSLTVGGIWTRPCKLPDLGSYYSIIRFFELPLGWNGSGRTAEHYESVIGVGTCVPVNRMMGYYKRFIDSGATWVWASMPNVPNDAIAGGFGRSSSGRIKLDHAEIFKLLDEGATVTELKNRFETSATAIEYIRTKWKNNQPAVIAKKPLDWEAIAEDLRLGVEVQEIANKHQTSRTSIYNIKKKYQIL